MSEADASLFLSPYRVLDLTDERGLLCGRILADLGADVVQIEPPEGSHARNLDPYYRDQVHPERSLFWWAYANNKRSITLNLETSDGRDILGRLVKDAHFLLESFSPGYLDGLGAGYRALSDINPGLVMISITAFGQSGPYSERAATDLVGMATGGIMYLTGDSDRAPVRVGFPQFYLHGSAAGATGAMLAHTHRALTGEGQHVDVSCQQATARSLAHAPQFWDIQGIILKRMGVFRQSAGETMTRINWRCKDGYVNFQAGGGGAGSVRSVRALLEWMDQEGMGDEYLNSVEWESLGYGTARPEIMERTAESVARFFETLTREELVRGAEERRIILFPVAAPGDIMEYPQLVSRSYFQTMDHPELGDQVTYPGLFVSDEVGQGLSLRRRPPLIGEHNVDIYQGELGYTSQQVAALRQAGVL